MQDRTNELKTCLSIHKTEVGAIHHLQEEEETFACFCQPKLADHMCPKGKIIKSSGQVCLV